MYKEGSHSIYIIEMLYRLNVFVTIISLLFSIVYNFLANTFDSYLRRELGSIVSISNVLYYNKCTKCSN